MESQRIFRFRTIIKNGVVEIPEDYKEYWNDVYVEVIVREDEDGDLREKYKQLEKIKKIINSNEINNND